jgi:hypothetical protein
VPDQDVLHRVVQEMVFYANWRWRGNNFWQASTRTIWSQPGADRRLYLTGRTQKPLLL